MQGQPEPRQSPGEHRHHALRVVLAFEPENGVIRVPDEDSLPSQPRQHLLRVPQVQRVAPIEGAPAGTPPPAAGRAAPGAPRLGSIRTSLVRITVSKKDLMSISRMKFSLPLF